VDILSQSSLLVAVTSFALGFSTLARNVKNKLFLLFAVLTTLISLWAMAFFLERFWPGWGFYRAHLFFNIWLAPAAISFVRVMNRTHDWVSKRLFDVSLFMAGALSLSLGAGLDSIPFVHELILFLPGFVVLQILHLMAIDRRLKHGAPLKPKLSTVGFERKNLIYLGGLLVLATSVMDHIPWMGTVLPSLGNLALSVYGFFISQAISQQRFLNFGALFSRFLVLLAVALSLTLGYSLLVAWIEHSPGLFFLNSFIVSFAILTLLDPLRAAVGYFTRRLLTQKHLRLEAVLEEAGRRLVGIVEPGALFQAVLATTESTLQPQRAALYTLKSDGTKYRKARVTGKSHEDSGIILREILADHALVQLCLKLERKGELPILLDQALENELDRSASASQRKSLANHVLGLKALGGNLLIPLFDSGKCLAFVIADVPHPPDPWGNSWGLLSIIYPYYEAAGNSLRNLEIYTRQREKERLAALGEMAAGLAHEIRNPLGAIKGAAQFLDPELDRPESRFLKIIVEEVDRLNRVVTQFLDYSKPPVTEFKPVDLSDLAARTVEIMRPGLRDGIKLRFQGAAKPARVLASPEHLQQILINLIQNSAKALESRETGSISVATEVVESPMDGPDFSEVSLTVEDTGHGIKREHLDKLFIPFFTTSPSGTGLGLSISQKLVEAHQGRIEVATDEGRFARFSVIIPYARES
jgi:GAF domain-containing protein